MSVRMLYAPRAEEAERMSPAELRDNFLLDGLFEPGAVHLALTDLDRLIAGGAMPFPEVPLPACPELGTAFFHERRESGILNIGEPGAVRASGVTYPLGRFDMLYLGVGEQDVSFLGEGAVFYFLSCPAHSKHPTRLMTREQATVVAAGDELHASRRCIHQYIYPGGIVSCQLVMGFTELAPGSVWNTMPPHTHSRRSEIYLYFDLNGAMVMHLMGRPDSTRHLIVRDRQAVLSPPWSMHAGAGASSYRFAWGMAGENQAFADMDAIAPSDLR